MNTQNEQTIFIAGGYGLVGGNIAKLIRNRFPAIKLILAGRNPEKATDFAKELGNTEIVKLNMVTPFDLPNETSISLIIVAMDDHTNQLREAAIRKSIDVIYISEIVEEVAPIVFSSLHQALASKLIYAGHWQGGVLANVANHYLKDFKTVNAVNMVAVYDPKDPIGPTVANAIGGYTISAIIRKDKKWQFIDGSSGGRKITLIDGSQVTGSPMSVLDVPSVYAMRPEIADIRFDLVMDGISKGTAEGKSATHELYIEIEGKQYNNENMKKRILISGTKGQAHMTAAGIVLIVEDLLDINYAGQLRNGLHLPETIVKPQNILARLADFGIEVKDIK